MKNGGNQKTNDINGSRQDIKNSFHALFSPGPGGVSPSPFLSGAYPYYPGITPYIAPSQSPPIGETEDSDGKKGMENVDKSALMTSPHLRRAAKEAMAREFMNMPTFATGGVDQPSSGTLSTASVEQTVPGGGGASDGKEGTSAEHGVPVSGEKKDGKDGDKGEGGEKTGVGMPHMIPMYPMNMRGFPQPPPGMHAMHPMGYPMQMMFAGHPPQHMMGGYMPVARNTPFKQPIKANETAEEKKARIEREKEDLIREFKKKTREAALVRFRQKRRERKFGKLIRYDCRKKLADARPRVKGRFVRVKTPNDDDAQVVPGVK